MSPDAFVVSRFSLTFHVSFFYSSFFTIARSIDRGRQATVNLAQHDPIQLDFRTGQARRTFLGVVLSNETAKCLLVPFSAYHQS